MPMTIEEFKSSFRKFIASKPRQDADHDASLRVAIKDAVEALRVAERRLARLGAALRKGESLLGREIAEASPFVNLLTKQKGALEKALSTEDAGKITGAAKDFATWLGGDAVVALIDAPNPHNIALGLRGGLKDAMDNLARQAT